MKTQHKTFNVYFQTPNNSELIGTFETLEEAKDKAVYPGMYWSKELEKNCEAYIEILSDDLYITNN